ncbi:MAG TPA: hypothetical protein VKM55_13275 [Candidatus Lokiarchaeia archaeon]|nr:hypothetical protein [Candidatus Lokiarchaeia archaeon]
MKQNTKVKEPVLHTERYLLVKVDGDEDRIKDLLRSHEIMYEDFIVHSVVPDS